MQSIYRNKNNLRDNMDQVLLFNQEIGKKRLVGYEPGILSNR